MINDRHMAVGDWSLELKDDTPQQIRDEFKTPTGADEWKTSVLFFENDVLGYDGTDLSDTFRQEVADEALWCGPVWKRGNKLRRFSGPSMMGWMGNQKGSPYRSGYGGSGTPTWPATISLTVNQWFGSGTSSNGIQEGGAASPNLSNIDNVANGTYLPPVKGPLDTLMGQTENEYWVRPTGELDWGDAQSLFQYPPVVVAAEGMRENIDGYTLLDVPEDGVQYDEDIMGWRNAAKVVSQDYDLDAGTGTAAVDDTSTSGPDVRTWMPTAAAQFCGPIIRADTNDLNDVTQLAAIASGLFDYTNRTIRVTCNDPCALSFVKPGDWVYVWSPENGVFNTGNEITVDGQVIHPEAIRVVAVRQPFTAGMGAYVVRYVGSAKWNFKRITPWIRVENQPVTIELGTAPNKYVPERFRSVIR